MADIAIEHITLTAPDISCDHCVATVNNALTSQEGVANVSVNATNKLVQIEFDPRKISVDQISKVLDEAGYPVSS